MNIADFISGTVAMVNKDFTVTCNNPDMQKVAVEEKKDIDAADEFNNPQEVDFGKVEVKKVIIL